MTEEQRIEEVLIALDGRVCNPIGHVVCMKKANVAACIKGKVQRYLCAHHYLEYQRIFNWDNSVSRGSFESI